MKNLRNHLLYKGYMALPWWGKVAIPVGLLVLVLFLKNTIQFAFQIGLFLLVAYVVFNIYLYITDKKKA